MDINKQLKTQEGAKDFMKDISEECRENILLAIKDVRQAEARESKIKNLLFLEKQILAKKNMQPHHRAWLKKRVEDLVKQEYKDSLVQLNECIDFTEA